MQAIVRSLVEGGWTVYVILGCGLLHAIPVIVQLAMLKKRDLTPYLWGGLLAILLIGLLGALIGVSESLSAVEQAQPDQVAALMARGYARLMNNVLWASLVALPGVFLTGIAASVTRNLAPVRLRP